MKAEELRKSILQYAIQGKLVPQIDTEEPASILLEKIKIEKSKLIKSGYIKKTKMLPDITESEIPFYIPENWLWTRFDNVAILYTGDSINAEEKKKKYFNLNEGYNYIATKDVGFDNSIDYDNGVKIPYQAGLKVAKLNSSLLCIEGGSAGRKVGLLNQDVCFGNKLCSFQPIIINPLYLFYFLQSPAFIVNFKDNKTGMIGGVGVNTLKSFCFSVPPLEEQHRIVARIEEMMILVDQYEEKQIELEKLEKEFPDKLKKSILQYAIQGKLVPQIDTEESASILLEKIRAEKIGLIKQGKIKKEKPMLDITDDEKPFDIPDSWEWTRLCEITISDVTYGIIKLYEEPENGVKVLRCSDIKQGWIDEKNIRMVSQALSKNYSRTILNGGEIVINVRGTLGGCSIVPNNYKGYNIAREVAMIRTSKKVLNKYIMYVLLSNYFNSYINSNLRGIAYKGLNMNLLSQFLIPLPPHEEQQRIIARIEELYELVDLLASGKKIKLSEKEKDIAEIKGIANNVITQSMFDIESVGLAARAGDNIDDETINEAKRQVQAFYEKKN